MLQLSASVGFPATGAVIATLLAVVYLYRNDIPSFLKEDL